MSDSPKPEVEQEENGEKRSRSRSRSRGKGKDKEKKRDKKSSRRSKSRSRDRDRRSKRSSKDKDKDRDRSRRRRSSRSKSPKRSSSKSRRSRSPEKEAAPPVPEPEPVAERDQSLYTVFVSQIHPKVDERDLFEFFSHVGRVEDIRLIRDQRTQKSKGLCYVEFSEQESVLKGVALSGQLIGGYPITITIIEANPDYKSSKDATGDGKTMRLYVGNLVQTVNEKDLEPVFEAFGPLDFIDLHKDPATGASRGFGFVQYKNEADAKAALGALNGLDIAGQAIKVGQVSEQAENIGSLDEEGARGGVAMTAAGRAELMMKLTRDGSTPGMGMPVAPIAVAPPQAAIGVPRIQPTTCVVIKNMFSPAEETDADFHLDIKEDVEEECSKFGPVKHIFVDKDDPSGRVYLRMQDVAGSTKLLNAFHGRWFASRQIQAEFVIEQTYVMKFPASAK